MTGTVEVEKGGEVEEVVEGRRRLNGTKETIHSLASVRTESKERESREQREEVSVDQERKNQVKQEIEGENGGVFGRRAKDRGQIGQRKLSDMALPNERAMLENGRS